MALAFKEGSGIDMDTLRTFIHILTMATTLFVMGSASLAAWKGYTSGAIEQWQLVYYLKKAMMVVLIIVAVLSFT